MKVSITNLVAFFGTIITVFLFAITFITNSQKEKIKGVKNDLGRIEIKIDKLEAKLDIATLDIKSLQLEKAEREGYTKAKAELTK